MSTCKKLLPIGAVALAFAFAPAEAAPQHRQRGRDCGQVRRQRGHPSAVGWGYRRYPYGLSPRVGAGPWLGLGAGVVIGSIIANEAYRPRRGYYYDDYAYDGPYYYPSALLGRSAHDLRPELPLVRVEYGPLYDLCGREAALPLPEVVRPSLTVSAVVLREPWPRCGSRSVFARPCASRRLCSRCYGQRCQAPHNG